MARRQEQESAREEVTEVAAGVLRMELPIRMPGLGHVNCYALLDREGAAVVDPGLPGPGTWRAIRHRLRRAGLRVRDVHTVVVTHSHPDHFGGAVRFAREACAKVVAHKHFRFGAPPTEPEVSVEDLDAQRDTVETDAGSEWASSASEVGGEEAGTRAEDGASGARDRAEDKAFRKWGGSTPWGGRHPRPPLKTRLRWRVMRWLGRSFIPAVTDPVSHGDVLRLAGREMFVFHTPGHTEDHICLHDPEEGLFLAGDHVLPTITPHISGLTVASDPLLSYFESLDLVGEIAGVSLVLPAHGHPFTDLPDRTEAIKRHHFERLERVKAIGRELGAATVEAFSQKLFHPRNWGSMAESETYAHLEHLRLAGEAERGADREGRYLYETG